MLEEFLGQLQKNKKFTINGININPEDIKTVYIGHKNKFNTISNSGFSTLDKDIIQNIIHNI